MYSFTGCDVVMVSNGRPSERAVVTRNLIGDFEDLGWHIETLWLEGFLESVGGGGGMFLFSISASHTKLRRQLIGAGFAAVFAGFALTGLTGSLVGNSRTVALSYPADFRFSADPAQLAIADCLGSIKWSHNPVRSGGALSTSVIAE